ncbi:MAG: glycosyl hydrolase, partial [Bacteroidota bacterium]
MKNFRFVLLAIAMLAIAACQNDNNTITQTGDTIWDNNRPHNPWVFRSVLDKQARMVTMALHQNLWVSYHADEGSLYKAWIGGVNFDGPVYTTVHGPQPTSVGDAWLLPQNKSPWRLIVNGEVQPAKLRYKGHRFENGGAELRYEIPTSAGQPVVITERPEYASGKNGLTKFQRFFSTSGLQGDMKVALETTVSSIATENDIETNGEWKVSDSKNSKNSTKTISGLLTLNSNGETYFHSTFVKSPAIKIIGAEGDLAEA